MTPSQIEHLKLIDAHLERLLAIAAKRTAGEWTHQVSSSDPNRALVNLRHANGVVATFATRSGDLNLEFAAFCAGNAEAGWRATRAVIATALNQESWDYMIKQMYIRQDAEEILKAILAAFPLELIQKP